MGTLDHMGVQESTLVSMMVFSISSMSFPYFIIAIVSSSTAIRNNIGYVYCFRARDIDEIKGNAELLQVDGKSEEVLQTFRNIETGCCVMRDPQGRVGVANIVPLPEYLLKVFSTRPGEREVEHVG